MAVAPSVAVIHTLSPRGLMFKPLCKLAATAALALGFSFAHADTTYSAQVVTFNDLASSQRISDISPGYQGFNWGSGFVTWADAGHPSRYTTFNPVGTTVTRADHQAFYFDGADFFLRDGAGTNDIYLFLYGEDGALVYNGREETYGKNHIVDTDRSRTFGAITGVDETTGVATFYSGLVSAVAFGWDGSKAINVAGNANDFGMDNFRYRSADPVSVPTPQVSAVPEMDTYAMMLTGLALMAGIARRRRMKA